MNFINVLFIRNQYYNKSVHFVRHVIARNLLEVKFAKESIDGTYYKMTIFRDNKLNRGQPSSGNSHEQRNTLFCMISLTIRVPRNIYRLYTYSVQIPTYISSIFNRSIYYYHTLYALLTKSQYCIVHKVKN